MEQDHRDNAKLFIRNLIAIFVILWPGIGSANDYLWSVNLETGAVWQNRNDVRIPGDSGTRYSIADIAGEGPFQFYRFEYFFNLSEKNQLRFHFLAIHLLGGSYLEK